MAKETNVKQPNALLTFAGEQDVVFFAAAIREVANMVSCESGGSREVSVRAENGNIVLGYKVNLNV